MNLTVLRTRQLVTVVGCGWKPQQNAFFWLYKLLKTACADGSVYSIAQPGIITLPELPALRDVTDAWVFSSLDQIMRAPSRALLARHRSWWGTVSLGSSDQEGGGDQEEVGIPVWQIVRAALIFPQECNDVEETQACCSVGAHWTRWRSSTHPPFTSCFREATSNLVMCLWKCKFSMFPTGVFTWPCA